MRGREMDREEADAIVRKMKAAAGANPWVPIGVAPRERYHRLPDGLSLCFTLDVLSKDYLNRLARAFGEKPPGRLAEGSRFWHLSVARPGCAPTLAEVAFWRRAFFEKAPFFQMGGIITAVNSRHFFWKAE